VTSYLAPLSLLCWALAGAAFLKAMEGLRRLQWARARAEGQARPAMGVAAFLAQSRLDAEAFLRSKLPWKSLPAKECLDSLLGGAAFGLLGLWLAGQWGAGLGLALGLGLPWLRLRDARLKRLKQLRLALPDALDLLALCVGAGLGFDQALARTASKLPEGPLKAELQLLLSELGTGLARAEALRRLERRCKLEELSRLASLLIQAERRGLSLGPVLKEMARNLRALRSLRMKKLASEAPLKMLLPLMAFILPVVFIVLFGPIVLRWQSGGF
jgi:tight adherence protein C